MSYFYEVGSDSKSSNYTQRIAVLASNSLLKMTKTKPQTLDIDFIILSYLALDRDRRSAIF